MTQSVICTRLGLSADHRAAALLLTWRSCRLEAIGTVQDVKEGLEVHCRAQAQIIQARSACMPGCGADGISNMSQRTILASQSGDQLLHLGLGGVLAQSAEQVAQRLAGNLTGALLVEKGESLLEFCRWVGGGGGEVTNGSVSNANKEEARSGTTMVRAYSDHHAVKIFYSPASDYIVGIEEEYGNIFIVSILVWHIELAQRTTRQEQRRGHGHRLSLGEHRGNLPVRRLAPSLLAAFAHVWTQCVGPAPPPAGFLARMLG